MYVCCVYNFCVCMSLHAYVQMRACMHVCKREKKDRMCVCVCVCVCVYREHKSQGYLIWKSYKSVLFWIRFIISCNCIKIILRQHIYHQQQSFEWFTWLELDFEFGKVQYINLYVSHNIYVFTESRPAETLLVDGEKYAVVG